MGFSYKDWEGGFYPPEVSARNYLAYYSRIFNAVEIDSTFYGTPRATTVQRWREVTPADFKFCLKTPRLITHDLGLAGAEPLMDEFLQAAGQLGDKLGAILLQFPPSFTAANLAQLSGFLRNLPDGFRFAVEIRDASWYAPEIEQVMEAALRETGVAWAATEYPDLPARLHPTTDFFYIRWIGQHGTFKHHDLEQLDRMPELETWLKNLQEWQGRVETVFGFFNNDYSGFAAGTALRFRNLAGIAPRPDEPPRQGRLF